MSIVVTGYASLDYSVRLDTPASPDRTSTILSRPREWPRLGGSPAYVCAALAATGVADATPVSWVGDDDEGARYRDELRRLGVSTDGVRGRPGRTPVCLLAYQPDGGCLCFYDPGLVTPIRLDASQRALVAAADALCLTVGPAEATREALALARALVVWAVKADARATPPDLAAALVERADVVIHNRGEAAFVTAAGDPRVRIETRGVAGVAIYDGRGEAVPVEPLAADDTTGAGDAWVGGFLAAYAARGAPLREAVRAGVESARAMLAARTKETA